MGSIGRRGGGGRKSSSAKTQKQLRITCPWVREEGEQWESSLGIKGLRDRNSPMCTLSQTGYGARRSELAAARTFFLPFPLNPCMCHVDGAGQKSAGENFSREWPLALRMLSLSVGSIGRPRRRGSKIELGKKNPETTAHHLPLGQRRRQAVGIEPGQKRLT